MQCPSGTANSSPIAGLTGDARSATGAQCRSRGPWRRTEVRLPTADQGQCVSARGRNSNAGPAGLASFAAWNRRAREEGPRRSQRSASAGSKVLKPPVVRPPFMASPLGADDAQGASSLSRLGCEGRNWPHGQAMGRAAIDNKNLGRQASGTLGARSATVKNHHSQGLRLSCAMHAGLPAGPG